MLRGFTPTRNGQIERDGASVRYEVFGSGPQAILLLPTWSIVHTDFWRHQVPHLAERYQVVTFDGLGNGASDRPTDPRYYADDGFAEDAVNVLDASGIDRAAVISASMAASWQLLLSDRHPQRVVASVYIAPDLPLAPLPPGYQEALATFDDHLSNYSGWAKWNRQFWYANWPEFCQFFFSRCFTEPGSDDEIAHFLSMGLETSPEVIAATIDANAIDERSALEVAGRLDKPTMVIHGTNDAVSSVSVGEELARLTSAELVLMPGAGHEPHCRDPVNVNNRIDRFLAAHLPVA